jgi:alkanesulfonate monooxygenase SsuD/methylene tetrahydromethanopterin reductase-like flavin-dependent oxidoreductase (luciferase family)
VHPVQFWVGGTVDASTERAGRLGDGWLTAQNTPADGLAHQLALYKDACRAAGREPFPVLRRDILVAATDAEAHAVVDPVLAEGYRGSGTDELLIGSPETVVEQIRRWHALGFPYLSVRHIPGDHAGMLESFRLIGEQVMPAIRGW